MIAGDHKILTRIIHSGQPRPYADTETVAQVSFLHVPIPVTRYFRLLSHSAPADPIALEDELKWEPYFVNETYCRKLFPHLAIGFTNDLRQEHDWYASYLDYLKPLDLNSENMGSKWEFRTVQRYTD